jgi:uncharacterized protein (DUF2384 family)
MDFADQVSALQALVERIVRESGKTQGFDAQAWLTRWLDETLPALAGRRPADVLREPGGYEQVRTIVARMQSGAYS